MIATALRFDDSAPRGMRGEREQLAAFLASAAAELDSGGPDDLAAIGVHQPNLRQRVEHAGNTTR